MNKISATLLVLFILISFGAGYISPLLFLKWVVFLLAFIFIIRQFIKRNKSGDQSALKKFLTHVFFILVLAVISVPVTDVAKAKRNSVVCPFDTIHKSEYLKQIGSIGKMDLAIVDNQLNRYSSFFSTKTDSILHENRYYHFKSFYFEPKDYRTKVLVLAGVHGDEPAGVLSIPHILDELEKTNSVLGNTAIRIVCPVNPVGFMLESRENECGCNINRDYLNPTQIETKNIVKHIEDFQPDLIIDLHENNGNWETCVMVNKLISDEMGKQLCQSLSENGIALTDYAFDTSLPFPGWLKRSTYREKINDIAGLHDLMWYGQTKNIPVLTLECDQSLPIAKRITICNLTIEKAISIFNSSHK